MRLAGLAIALAGAMGCASSQSSEDEPPPVVSRPLPEDCCPPADRAVSPKNAPDNSLEDVVISEPVTIEISAGSDDFVSPYESSQVETVPNVVSSYDSLDRAVELDFRSILYSEPEDGFPLGQVTFDLYPRSDRFDFSAPSYFDFNNRSPWERGHDDYQDTEFETEHLRVVLLSLREVVRQGARDYSVLRWIDRRLRYIERLGRKVSDVVKAFEAIYTFDLSDPLGDLADPLRPMREALGVESSAESRGRKDYGPVVSGSLEPTAFGRPLIRSGRVLQYAMSGESLDMYSLDLGVQLEFRIDF